MVEPVSFLEECFAHIEGLMKCRGLPLTQGCAARIQTLVLFVFPRLFSLPLHCWISLRCTKLFLIDVSRSVFYLLSLAHPSQIARSDGDMSE